MGISTQEVQEKKLNLFFQRSSPSVHWVIFEMHVKSDRPAHFLDETNPKALSAVCEDSNQHKLRTGSYLIVAFGSHA